MTLDAGLPILQNRAMRLLLDPQRGGAIRELSWLGRPVLRPAPATGAGDPFEMACFPMAPYVNRVARGRFSFGGHSVQLDRNWDADPHPLHGQGWRRPWTTVNISAAQATLSFEGGGDDWPWRYVCEQRFQLLDNGVSIGLSVENSGSEAMPVMLGLHPYFPDAAHAHLEARLPSVWLTDSEVLPVKEIPTPSEWRFQPSRAIDSRVLDHTFADWDGVATLRWPEYQVTLRATECRHLHVYAPAGRGFFCVEPQSAPPGALGRDAGEAKVLNPGERFGIQVQIEAGAL